MTRKQAFRAYFIGSYSLLSDKVGTNLDKIQNTGSEKIDPLYQSESYLELLNVKYVLEKIKALP